MARSYKKEMKMQNGICLSVVGLFIFCSMAMADLVDNGDQTITDTATGLMWQQLEVTAEDNSTVLRMTWKDALDYCEKLDLAGYDDWRLPNAKELQSIVNYEKSEPPYIDEIFQNAAMSGYWSSTTVANDTYNAWYVHFHYGYVNNAEKHENIYLRAVRGGK
jgi:formylglycine-generating enzyme required for sulfatase activity